MSLPRKGLRILFVCRGSALDGLGHVIRSRTLATAMSRFNTVKMAIVGSSYVETLLTNKEIDYRILNSDSEVIDAFPGFDPQVVVLDLLSINFSCFMNLKRRSVTVSLSPICNCLQHVDMIFHRTTVLDTDWQFWEAGPVIRAGLRYAIIGEHCRRIPTRVYKANLSRRGLSVAVSMGGTDAANKTLTALDVIKKVNERMLLWVFLGEGYAHSFEDLVRCMRGSKHEIILAKTNDSMWRILSTCSLLVVAGGTTTYEAAYAGLPTVNTLETADHFFLIRELVEKRSCLCAGETFAASLANLEAIISDLSGNRRELLRMHENSKRLIDGLAIKRITRDIKDMYHAIQSGQPPRDRIDLAGGGGS
jgi:spore coat polysaccharide biosynthesis predicted glycosyltransferase SpsG